jgi:hypothetical protein
MTPLDTEVTFLVFGLAAVVVCVRTMITTHKTPFTT